MKKPVSDQDLKQLFERPPIPAELEGRITADLAREQSHRRWPWMGAAAAALLAVAVSYDGGHAPAPVLVAAMFEHAGEETGLSGALDADFSAWLAAEGLSGDVLSDASMVKNCRVQGMGLKHVRLDSDGHGVDLFLGDHLGRAGDNGRLADRRWRVVSLSEDLQAVVLYEVGLADGQVDRLLAGLRGDVLSG